MFLSKKEALSRLRGIAVVAVASLLTVSPANAQRKTDALDRGLVAVTQSSGVFLSWRVQADEPRPGSIEVLRTNISLSITSSVLLEVSITVLKS